MVGKFPGHTVTFGMAWSLSLIVKDLKLLKTFCSMFYVPQQFWKGQLFGTLSHIYPHLFGTDFEKARIDFLSKPIKGYFSPSVPSYFHLAALASKDVRILNSIVKYQLSTQIYSQHFMDLHESINWKTTEYSYIQMRFAFAIITAYSVIEELGLEINGAPFSESNEIEGEM